MTDKPTTVIERGTKLLIGFKQQDNFFQDFTLSPPRGRLRREVANAASAGPMKVRIASLQHILKSIGPLAELPVNPFQILRSIPAPDVDLINFWATVKANGSRHLSWPAECPHCGHEVNVTVDLAKVGLVEGSDEIQFDTKGRPFVEFTFFDPIAKRDVPVGFRVPTMGDQEAFFARLDQNKLGDFDFENMAVLMTSYDGHAPLTAEQLDDMPLPTLDALKLEQMNHHATSLDMDVAATCPADEGCGAEFETQLPVDRWLAPFERRGQ